MDKASDYESGDSRFESWQGRFFKVYIQIYQKHFPTTVNCQLLHTLAMLNKMIPPGLEPGTLRVLGARDNHYTTESMLKSYNFFILSSTIFFILLNKTNVSARARTGDLARVKRT